ncbi:hypothetical protein [Aureispira sp. CCB-E]|uniref:hypothetical protein n=1 Tax=Aureispira sp. CCB-E TaxID=3051121 RepID=UPI002868EBDF|nr:hypothetical protein [Aureispira sp. CCB-E]WMX17564.1 hypothetical protein QP953_28510 [Aureispira sp. CCB-E]
MYKLEIEQLILKKDCNAFIKHFFDISMEFFLLLLVHQETFELAYLEKGSTLNDYVITLDSNNTRVLHNKNFEFKSNKDPLEFSLILLGNYRRLAMNRIKIKKLIHTNAFINTRDRSTTLFHQLFTVVLPVTILRQENTIKFDNPTMSINFSLKTT